MQTLPARRLRVLYVLVLLVLAEEFAGGYADRAFEVARKMALVHEAHERGGLGNGSAEPEKRLGFQDAHL